MNKVLCSALFLAAGTVLSQAAVTSLSDAIFSDTVLASDSLSVSSAASSISGSYSFAVTYTLNTSEIASILTSSSAATSMYTLVSLTNSDSNTLGAVVGRATTTAYGVYGIASSSTSTTSAQAGTGVSLDNSQRYSLTATSNYTSSSYLNNLSNVDISQMTDAAVTMIFTTGSSGYTTYVLTFKVGETTYTTSGYSTSLRYSSGFGTISTMNVNTSLVSSVYLFAESVDVATAASLNQLAVAAIPEPSSFGILAGLGALALVASRRRRSRKTA